MENSRFTVMDVTIETMISERWQEGPCQLSGRYRYRTGNATVDSEALEWDTRDTDHLTACRLVAKEGGLEIGWVAISQTSRRAPYFEVMDKSIYVATMAHGK